jgi:hypothetical protein
VGRDGGAALPRAPRLMMMKQFCGADFDINTHTYIRILHAPRDFWDMSSDGEVGTVDHYRDQGY